MSNSTLHANGWISVSVSARHEQYAKKIRAERDALYGNIFTQKDTDQRWVGDLGEIVFKSWLTHMDILGAKWIVDSASGQPDFILPDGTRIDIKTVKRKGDPQAHFEAGMTTRHAHEPIDQFFFMSYVPQTRLMWLLGGIGRERFLKQSVHFKAGDFVHPSYQIREGHEINNIALGNLDNPAHWLSRVVGRTDQLAA